MCYYSLWLHLDCGHGVASKKPLKNAPPCPQKNKSLFETSSRTSPITPVSASILEDDESQKENKDPRENGEKKSEGVCQVRNYHPLHTYRVPGLCQVCNQEKAERIAKFEIAAIHEGVDRGFVKARRKERFEIHGTKLRTLRSGYEAGRKSREGKVESELAEEKVSAEAQNVEKWLNEAADPETRIPESLKKCFENAGSSLVYYNALLKRPSVAKATG